MEMKFEKEDNCRIRERFLPKQQTNGNPYKTKTRDEEKQSDHRFELNSDEEPRYVRITYDRLAKFRKNDTCVNLGNFFHWFELEEIK